MKHMAKENNEIKKQLADLRAVQKSEKAVDDGNGEEEKKQVGDQQEESKAYNPFDKNKKRIEEARIK